jgi:hypothetical protein
MIQKGQLICTFTVTLTIYIDNNSLKSMKLTYLKIFNNILRTAVRFRNKSIYKMSNLFFLKY